MITEHAILSIVAGREAEFEQALDQALPLISASPGFGGITISRSIESPGDYLLLVTWDSVEAHTEGFRGSPAYDEWRALLHHFYDPAPIVEHFVQVRAVAGDAAG